MNEPIPKGESSRTSNFTNFEAKMVSEACQKQNQNEQITGHIIFSDQCLISRSEQTDSLTTYSGQSRGNDLEQNYNLNTPPELNSLDSHLEQGCSFDVQSQQNESFGANQDESDGSLNAFLDESDSLDSCPEQDHLGPSDNFHGDPEEGDDDLDASQEEDPFAGLDQGSSFDNSEQSGSNKTYDYEWEFKCGLCLKSFARKRNLVRHFKSVHEKIKSSECSLCSKTFATKDELTRHVRCVHDKIKLYKCQLCPESYGRKDYLTKHFQAVHENLKKFECKVCFMLFSMQSNLIRHTKIVHEKLKLHKCDICSKSFGTNGELTKHVMSVHEKVKPFKCEKCPLTFSRKPNLAQHVLAVHENVKNFKCDLCSKRFFRKDHLPKHIIAVHENAKKFKCEFCTETFNSETKWTLHISNAHINEEVM